jgi:hypothetical protein
VPLVAADAEPLLVREHRLLEHLFFDALVALPHDGAATLAEAHLVHELARAVGV